jgi:hypothetical protein
MARPSGTATDNPFLSDTIAAGGGPVWGAAGRAAAPPSASAAAAPRPPPSPGAQARAAARDNPFAQEEEDDSIFVHQPPSPQPLPAWAGGSGGGGNAPTRSAGAAATASGRPPGAVGVAESLYSGLSPDAVARELASRERALAAREAALQRREADLAASLRRIKAHNCASRARCAAVHVRGYARARTDTLFSRVRCTFRA